MHDAVTDADNFQTGHLMKDFVKHLDMPGVWKRYLVARSSGEFRSSARRPVNSSIQPDPGFLPLRCWDQ